MENGSWVMADRNTVLMKVMKDKLDMLNKYFHEFHHEIPVIFTEAFDKWYYSMRCMTGKEYYNVRNELNMCAMNID
jgi:hypothetical protein